MESEDEYSESDRTSWSSVPLYLHNAFLPRFAYAPDLNELRINARHDVLHRHGLWLYPSIAVSRWQRNTGRPVVVSTQGMLERWALDNGRHKKRIAALLFERSSLRGAACIHCSKAEVPAVRAFGLSNPIAVIPNGADLPHHGNRLPRPAWLPDDGRRTLLFLGRIHPKKGIRETLQAWALLSSQETSILKQWRLVIAGWDDGGHIKSLIEHAQSLGLRDVIFPGPLFAGEKLATFAHADAFILASHSEGLPMAVLEAWSYSLPVFMTHECNLPEGFDEGAAIKIQPRRVILRKYSLNNFRATT